MHCGTVSGRTHDKFAETKLSTMPSEIVDVPVIAQCGINYECRVLHKNDVSQQTIALDIKNQLYPGGDFHRIYYGEILRVRADADFLTKK